MKEPPCKMFIYYIFFCTLLLCNLTTALPSPEPARFSNDNGGGFISNPSIYSYTIANQNTLPNRSNDVNYAHANSNNNNNNNNFINFASNANYHSSSGSRSSSSSNSASSSSRNFYYANKDTFSSASTADSILSASTPTQPAPISGCNLDRLAVYKVVLHTYWTRDLFPKHYPDWRPSAQWTKTLGRTHDDAYALFHMGQQATPGVKQFAETGKADILDSLAGEQQQRQQKSTGNSFTTFVNSATASAAAGNGNSGSLNGAARERNVFDEFNIPGILNGAGRNEAKFFVDSNHSLVSLMTRIVPSPDWFIGVDSFQLCVGGSWIDTVTVEMDPLDAGTDNGFTFTAPNWPTSPQGVIYRITARYPAHPAGSFFYPKSKRLPPIATFQFIKLKEYELSEVFNFAEDDRKYETVKTQTHLETEHNHVEMNNELSASIERERQNEISSSQTTSVSERDRIRSKLLAKMNPMYNNSLAANIVPKNDKNAIMQNIANSYHHRAETSSLASQSSAAQSSSDSTLPVKRRRTKKAGPRDCRVSHWSAWTPCSKTCGIGEMHRYRKVIKHGKRGGRPCPALQESKWCGTEKGCHSPSSYFNWSDT